MVSFLFQLLTPHGATIQEQVSSVTLPTRQGEIGVLPGHCDYVGLLGSGLLSYLKVGEIIPRSIVVHEGSCQFRVEAHNGEIQREVLIVLADDVELGPFDIVTLEMKRKGLIEALAEANLYDFTANMPSAMISRADAYSQLEDKISRG